MSKDIQYYAFSSIDDMHEVLENYIGKKNAKVFVEEVMKRKNEEELVDFLFKTADKYSTIATDNLNKQTEDTNDAKEIDEGLTYIGKVIDFFPIYACVLKGYDTFKVVSMYNKRLMEF